MVFWNSFDESQAAYNESYLKFYNILNKEMSKLS
jgi:hypothetical protein